MSTAVQRTDSPLGANNTSRTFSANNISQSLGAKEVAPSLGVNNASSSLDTSKAKPLLKPLNGTFFTLEDISTTSRSVGPEFEEEQAKLFPDVEMSDDLTPHNKPEAQGQVCRAFKKPPIPKVNIPTTPQAQQKDVSNAQQKRIASFSETHVKHDSDSDSDPPTKRPRIEPPFGSFWSKADFSNPWRLDYKPTTNGIPGTTPAPQGFPSSSFSSPAPARQTYRSSSVLFDFAPPSSTTRATDPKLGPAPMVSKREQVVELKQAVKELKDQLTERNSTVKDLKDQNAKLTSENVEQGMSEKISGLEKNLDTAVSWIKALANNAGMD
ncbi:uncharacterized protein K452DRAFT_299144 [Aplosporella prunicola CBS 121167]|uniref:Uncharacterized protein n=1 Tax=Aplosporella prunicola CBS 121167 TaxID=1176127 RepID=A0A6A6BAI2_9PEZI|nr:uncharacterized protein K452DRAFT_299144 [Aplosporella prunicola CBS 121167]KAF2141100.1 hypothetical protein K452DRAFT_299144 [Aplosporella prunicola CBS 121167]